MILTYWPILVFITSLFFGGLGVAVGLTMWVMGRLSEQDARRIELKEALLLEIRQGNRIIFEKLDALNERHYQLTNRVSVLETTIKNSRI